MVMRNSRRNLGIVPIHHSGPLQSAGAVPCDHNLLSMHLYRIQSIRAKWLAFHNGGILFLRLQLSFPFSLSSARRSGRLGFTLLGVSAPKI